MNHPAKELYDLSYLNQVFQGNRQMINQIIRLFLEQVPVFVKEMQGLADIGKLESLHTLAHKAKSSVAMLGMKEVEELLLKIEFDSKNGRFENELEKSVSRLSDLIHHATEMLRKELSASSAA